MSQEEWDLYFLKIAKAVATKSRCLSRQIGSVLVKDNVIIGTGYNGPPRGIPHCSNSEAYFKVCDGKESGCPRKAAGYESGEGLEHCIAVHAERNALLAAAKNGTSTNNSTLYCYCPPPCQECMKEIIQAGVKRIVCMKGDWYDFMSEYLVEKSGIELVQYEEILTNKMEEEK